jgi:glutathione synthase/RimK-type ligase-like ATP-grasp enzyme
MKIAIHYEIGSFSDRWIDYCKKKNISYKIVDCYSTDIISQLEDCDALMWHHHHGNYKDVLFAKQLIYSVEQSGKKTFPDYKTCWHFDDKIGQKYLFESIGAPLAPSYVFYTRQEALQWINHTTFPKVFKLRGGAGSANVKLVKTAQKARRLTGKAFGRGYSQFDRIGYFKERYNKYCSGRDSLLEVLKAFGRLFIGTEFSKMHSREKGYIYFQDFVPNNSFDIRVIVVDGKAFGAKRMVRKNDFRASGSGNLFYEKEHIPINSIELAFQLTDNLQLQSAAFDFVYDESCNPLVIEVSYGFPTTTTDHCIGYWDKLLNYHLESFKPQEWMVEAIINQ